MTAGIGLAVLRIGVGLLLAGHGCQKLFGWFRGHGLTGTAAFFDSVGYRPGRYLAALAGICELTAGLLFATGLLTPLGAAIAIGTMLAAAALHVRNGLWATDGGFELPGCYALMAAALGFTGAGRYSLDHWLGYTWSWRYGLAALLVGLVAGAAAITARSRQLHRSRPDGAEASDTPYPHDTATVPVQRHTAGQPVHRSAQPRAAVRAMVVSRRIVWH